MGTATGNRSTGNWSTGDRSTGDRSTGDCSTGNWSVSNFSTGHFSTIDYSGFGSFNKHCTLEEWENAEKPDFLYFNLAEWIDEESMTEEEKQYNPRYKIKGGYLKVKEYKQAWRDSWNEATEEDRRLVLNLPNFDNEIFKEISGIDVEKELNTKIDKIKIGDFEYDKKEIEERLKGLTPIN